MWAFPVWLFRMIRSSPARSWVSRYAYQVIAQLVRSAGDRLECSWSRPRLFLAAGARAMVSCVPGICDRATRGAGLVAMGSPLWITPVEAWTVDLIILVSSSCRLLFLLSMSINIPAGCHRCNIYTTAFLQASAAVH